MPSIINPLITDAGLAAAIAAGGTGLASIAITHIALGTGQYATAGAAGMTALVNRKEKVTIAGGFVNALGSFRLNAIFPAWAGVPNPYSATEIGFFAGDPDAGGLLFAVYSHVSDVLVVRNSLDYIASFGLQLSRVPAGSVTISLDPSGAQALVLISNHEAAADPHIVYMKKTGGVFTGPVEAPTPDFGDSDASVATTEFVQVAIADSRTPLTQLYFMGQL